MKNGANRAFTFEGFTLDLTRGCLLAGNDAINLRPKSFSVLSYLVENPGRLVRKDELAQVLWPNVIASDDSLAQCISDLRNALNDVERRIIKTVTGRGYLFAAPVSISVIEGTNHSPVFTPPRLSIVVLPFANLSGDPDQEYFADGVTDDLTTDLSRISGSFVIARSTAFTFKAKPVDVKRIGRELGVRYVLEGSVQRAGDQVRMNVQLIDAEGGAHVWADRFETNRTNLAEAQMEITGRIAHALNLELVKDVGRRIEQERPVDPDVQDLIMRGWYWWYRTRSTIAMQEAQHAFERALEIDPRSVDARIGIATVLLVNSIGNFAPRSNSSFERDSARAEQLLLEAIESDPSRPMAHTAMGRLRRVQNRLAESQIEHETAIALGADDDHTHGQLSWTLLLLGQPDGALIECEKTLRLSPRDPNIWGTYLVLGWCQLLLNQVDRAIDSLTKSRAANPRPWITHFGLAAALGLKGDLDGAKTALVESLKLNPEVDTLARLRVYRASGNSQYWALFEQTAAAGVRRVGFPDE